MNVYAVINGKKQEDRLLEMLRYRARFYAARVHAIRDKPEEAK